ncbi:hypothetical protein AB0F17_05330 [Nonomuraea sp. NPDC026600]|uniref:hypothetical protein n=1 Tax=Nonomuraea sp. NPDC026600 TaxID=3155363 RepID=UPI0033C4A7A1
MNGELPAGLRMVHSFVAADAPYPRSDEMSRLQGSGSWMDLASAAKDGKAQADPAAAQVRAAGNHSGDVNVFEDDYGLESKRMDDGFVAAALVGTGTAALVVFKTAWKYLVVITLIVLLLALIRGFRLGPVLGVLFGRRRIMETRQALAVALAQVEGNIARGAVTSLQLARRMLTRAMIIPGAQTALAGVNTMTLNPWDDIPQAREDTERVLNETAAGREALAYAREHGITTLYQSGENIQWSDYNRQLNVIRIGGADTAGSEALAAEFVRQVHMAKDRWGNSPVGTGFDEYSSARDKQEEAANQEAYRMGSQLGHEQEARDTYVDSGYGSSYQRHLREHDDGLQQAILGGPFKLFNDGPLDFT